MNRNIPCERVEPDLTGYLLGALPAAREAELRTHLETCERCRASAKELADTLDLLRGALAASPDTPAALSPERRAKVLAARCPVLVEAWHTWLYPVARAALLLLVPGVLLSALLLPAMMGGRASMPIIGKLSDAPATDAYFDHGAPGAAPAAAAPVPTAAPAASGTGPAGGAGRWDTGGADWAMRPASRAVTVEKLAEAAPTDKSAPGTKMNFEAIESGRDSRGTVARRLGAVRGDEITVAGQAASASDADRTLQRVTLTGGHQVEGLVRELGNGAIQVNTLAGSSMRILPSQLAANGAIAPAAPVSGPAPAAEQEGRERSKAYTIAGVKTRTASPADPFGGEPVKNGADPFAYSDRDGDAPAERPAGGPGFTGGGYQAGMGGGGGPVAGLKYGTTPPAGSVSEVRKNQQGDRSDLGLVTADDSLATVSPTAAAKEESAKEVYVPLRPKLPKPMFVGTPVPAKAPNMEAAGTRQTYDLPAAVVEGRAVIATAPEPAAATAPATPPPPAAPPPAATPALPMAPPAAMPPMSAATAGAAPAPSRKPVPALGDLPVLGSVFKREEREEATRESADAAAKGKSDARYYYRGAAVAGKDVADQKDMNGRISGEADGKALGWAEGGDGTIMKGLIDARSAGGRASEMKALTKSGSGTLDLSGVNAYAGGTIVNGGALTLGGNTVAAPTTPGVPPPVTTAPAKPWAGVPATPGDSQVAQHIDRLQVADLSAHELRDADKKQKSETAYALAVVAHDEAAETARPAAAEGEKRLEELQDLRKELTDAENKPVDTLRRDAAKAASEPAAPPKFTAAGFNPIVEAKENAFSTFSIDVDTASYAMARRAILEGRRPEPESVRTEEFVNSFDYDYAPPASGTFAVHIEGAPSPFRKQFDLLKIGVKAQRIGRDGHRGAVLTFVVDTSGSMNTEDRLGLIRSSLRMLVERLAPEDLVAIVTFNNRASLALEPTPAAQKDAILAAVANLETAGSTQLEGGLRLGYEVAARAFRSGASNRVILMSDGVANLGAADAEAILRAVEEHRKQGIYCTVLGFGTGTYDDTMLESLANKGDGTYVYIDSIDEAKRVLVDELAATLHTVARDVKIQVEFNPERVKRWRQLGYENRKLEKEQFRDDTVDAGEVGSGQSVTALYDVELQGRPEQPIATVRVRYRNLETGAVEEIEHRVTARQFTRDFAAASPRFRLAAGVAEFAELLRMSPYTFSGGRDFNDVAAVIRPVALELRLDDRVQELARLVQAAPSLPGS